MELKIDSLRKFKTYRHLFFQLMPNKNSTFFSSFEWFRILVKEYYNNVYLLLSSKAYISIYSSNNRIKAIFAFFIKKIGKKKGIFLLGSGGKSDYLDIIKSDDFSDVDFSSLFSLIKSKMHVSNFHFYNLSSKSNTSELIINNSLTYKEIITEAYELQFSSYDIYYNSLSKNFKQNIRTSYNKLKSSNKTYRLELIEHISNFTLFIISFIYAKRLINKNNFFKFFFKYLFTFDPYFYFLKKNKSQNLAVFKINESIAAYMIFFKNLNNDTYYLSRIVLNSKFSKFSPGILMILEFIKNNSVNNTNSELIFDFTNGNEKYKKDFLASKKSVLGYEFTI